MASLAACVFLFVSSACDLCGRRIPNAITLTTCLAALIVYSAGNGLDGLAFSAFGLSAGFSLLIIPFLVGGTGAGDVKALAALGALIGPSAVFQTFLYTALTGGVIAMLFYHVVYDIREKARAGATAIGAFAVSRDARCLIPEAPKKKHKFPYAPAMLLGYLAYLTFGNLV